MKERHVFSVYTIALYIWKYNYWAGLPFLRSVPPSLNSLILWCRGLYFKTHLGLSRSLPADITVKLWSLHVFGTLQKHISLVWNTCNHLVVTTNLFFKEASWVLPSIFSWNRGGTRSFIPLTVPHGTKEYATTLNRSHTYLNLPWDSTACCHALGKLLFCILDPVSF